MAKWHSGYREKRKKPLFQRVLIFSLAILLIISLITAYSLYRIIFSPNVWTEGDQQVSVYIPTGADFNKVQDLLYSKGAIIHRRSFEWLASWKKYPDNIKPGRYILKNGMSNDVLLNMLRSGAQSPVRLMFNNVRTKSQLAGKIASQIEADSASIIKLLDDSVYMSQFGLPPQQALILFIPNTYEFWWNTDADQFIHRMYSEYQNFWNAERKDKAEKMNLSIPEVVTLASIIEKETSKNDEKRRIAGVYMNRLKKRWKLQADPTLIYAAGDFGIKRVLNVHKEIDSPYNTYKYYGLPPGPICIPSISSIDAVLNYEKDDYMYFCANPDMSGYHIFSKTLAQHNRNARAYQHALNQMKIMN